jgi:site-specific DNA recombinase
VYQDVWTGAEVFERPGLTALRTDMRAGAFDVLLVYALDRLSRDTNHQGLVLSEAEHAGVEWQSVTEDIDNSPQGKIMRAVIGGMAELERLKIAERTQRGKRARIESGKPSVGCRAPFGYRWEAGAKERLELDPMTAPIVRRIITSIAAGTSARQMTLSLMREGVPTPSGRSAMWHVSTIRALLNNPVYGGEPAAYRWSVTKVKGKRRQRPRPEAEHVRVGPIAPALVSPEILRAARERLVVNKRTATRNNAKPEASLLRGGFARCGYCGLAMRVQNEERGTFYRCNTSSRDQHGCPHHVISAHILDRAVLDKVQLVLNRPEIVSAEVARLRRDDPTQANREAVALRLAEVERKRGNLARRVAAIDDDDLAAPLLVELTSLGKEMAALAMQQDTLNAERASWEATQSQLVDLESWCRRVARNIDLLDYEGRRMALMALGVEVRVWATSHTPRYEIKMLPDAVPIPFSDPQTAGGVSLVSGHVDGYTHRGCARRGGHHAGRL